MPRPKIKGKIKARNPTTAHSFANLMINILAEIGGSRTGNIDEYSKDAANPEIQHCHKGSGADNP